MIFMSENGITAYDLPTHVASYDADMEIMHHNRSKMVDIALEILPVVYSERKRQWRKQIR